MPILTVKYGILNMGQLPEIAEGARYARVITASVDGCRAISDAGEEYAAYGTMLGKPGRDDGLTAGDWVELQTIGGTVYARKLLPRSSAFRRQSVKIGDSYGQIIAANIDFTLIVTSANQEFNPSRLERYMTAAWDSGAEPVVVITKADLTENIEKYVLDAGRAAPGAEVFAVSGVTGIGIAELREKLRGKTCVLAGSSGVGKSTLVNALAGAEVMRTQAIREDDAHGRHTTTHREMLLAGDAIVIDTPGMRGFGLWDADSLDQTFSDIAEVAEGCKFRDCKHVTEPGCAVKAAVKSGALDERRVKNYIRLQSSRKLKRRLESAK